ncbi:MAG: ABC transporter permease, partial [Bacteroidetes bacterium]|nr:ABC transporter permease [Bacteroidota bacterium]
MNVLNLVRLALRAMQRNKLRTFLTMLGIIIGVGAVITMIAIGQGSKQSIQASLSSMGSNMITVLPISNTRGGVRLAGSSIQTLKMQDVDAIKRLQSPYIVGISPVVSTNGQAIRGENNWPTNIQGVDVDYLDIRQ